MTAVEVAESPAGTPGRSHRYHAQARRRRLVRTGLSMLTSGFLAASVALFLADGGAGQFTSLGDGLLALGTVAGLLSTALMCLMVMLVARVPLIDRAFGQDKATILHTRVGNWVVYLVLAHAILLLTGYAISDSDDLLTSFASLWDGNTDFMWACVGLVLLVIITLVCIASVRRQFAYELWYVIHLLTYAAIVASLPHQFSMSGILAAGTLSRTLWIGVFLVTLFCLLTFRVFLPVFSTLQTRPVVSNVQRVGADAVSITVTGHRLDRLEARGGQWFQWRFLTPTLFFQPHPFSLSADPTGTTARITVRNLGAGSGRLQKLKPGTRVLVEGPYGTFTESSRTRGRVVLAGAGIGIAPIRALLESLPDREAEAVVILRASSPGELYLADEVRDLCEERQLTLFELVGNRAGARWLPASHSGEHLSDFVPWVADADVYACGPTAWMEAFFEDARLCGVPAEQMHRESFDW